MLNKIVRLALSLGLLALASFARPVFACTPPPGTLTQYTVSDHVRAATVVVEGVVLTLDDTLPRTATLQVKQYLKGKGPAIIQVKGYGVYPDCLPHIEVGQHLLFYLSGDAASGYAPFHFNQYDAFEAPEAQTIAEASAASGQDPILMSPAAINAALTPTPTLTSVDLSLLLTATPTPSLAPPPALPALNQMSTEAWATVAAAPILYPNDPKAQATFLTPAMATVQALYTAYALSAPTPTPYFPLSPTLPAYAPTQAPTALEVGGLIGIGGVIGLILGLFAGILIGLFIGRWRE